MLQSTLELYKLLAVLAQYTPPVIENGRELTCRRLQTFAVTNDYDAAAATDTLGKDSRYIGKGLFYSRSWYAAGQSPNYISAPYPQLLIGAMRERITPRGAFTQVTYTVAIIDKANEAQAGEANSTACDARTEEEVENDLRSLYLQLVANVKSLVYASLTSMVTPSASFALRWVSRNWLAAYLLADPTAQVQEHKELGESIDFEGDASFTKALGTSDSYAYVTSFTVKIANCAEPTTVVPPLTDALLANTPCC